MTTATKTVPTTTCSECAAPIRVGRKLCRECRRAHVQAQLSAASRRTSNLGWRAREFFYLNKAEERRLMYGEPR